MTAAANTSTTTPCRSDRESNSCSRDAAAGTGASGGTQLDGIGIPRIGCAISSEAAGHPCSIALPSGGSSHPSVSLRSLR